MVLKPQTSYQIKNNDKIVFGKIVAVFKTCDSSVDEGFLPSTPQGNRRNIAPSVVIPDTPEVSMVGIIFCISELNYIFTYLSFLIFLFKKLVFFFFNNI